MKNTLLFVKITLMPLLLAMSVGPFNLAFAETLPTVELTMHDGTLTPNRIEVPANTRFQIMLHNTGESPVEFESKRLRQEKVLAPGATAAVVINPLKPGEYEFIDEFHSPQAKGVIVAQ